MAKYSVEIYGSVDVEAKSGPEAIEKAFESLQLEADLSEVLVARAEESDE